MNSDEIRTAFLRFFEGKGHKVIPSSSLIPKGDPTLLLTTAGMVQVKPYFLGKEVPPAPRLASCQKCFRTTDIEEVGDATHCTFFEMLGNFSVGDYFKKEAIAWAWEFVTEWLKLSPEKMWITIYLDDDEAYKYWRETGIPDYKILRFGEEDNFWGPAGSSGPCGPCSEIHYDFGEEVGCGRADCKPNCECGRFSEIWNLVFTQYDQAEDGSRKPLPRPNIDTGMGLERVTAAVGNKPSIYETDLFAALVDRMSGLTGKKYGLNKQDDTAIRVVAEHGRAITFLIADGVMPDNEGRGYVLRRLLRRAALFGLRLGLDEPFLAEIARTTIKQMGHVYPELRARQDFVTRLIDMEEARFDETLKTGLEIINGLLEYRKANKNAISELVKYIKDSKPSPENAGKILEQHGFVGGYGIAEQQIGVELASEAISQLTYDYLAKLEDQTWEDTIKHEKSEEITNWPITVSGYEAFRLYDTYGFPIELTREIARERGTGIDMEGFEREMEKQRERARAAHRFDAKTGGTECLSLLDIKSTEFVGYHFLEQEAKIVRLMVDGKEVDRIEAGQKADIVLDVSPFYAEMGGQVGDTGEIAGDAGRFTVTDTVRVPPDIAVHQGEVTEGNIAAGETVKAIVDMERRRDIARNHTATHLLQSALRQVLGEHIQQRGSLVAPERLRFDFSHLAAMKPEEIREVQRLVNEKIRYNLRVYDEESSYQEAVKAGAIALFDEKYGDTVRVMKIGEPIVSAELCGGTHVDFTGEIGYFHIISEGSIGAGLRRIEAVTGRGAEAFIERRLSLLESVAESVQSDIDDVKNKVTELKEDLKNEKNKNLKADKEKAKNKAEDLINRVEEIEGINVLSDRVENPNMKDIREMADYIKDRKKSAIVILGAVRGHGAVLVASITPDIVEKGYNAGDILKKVTEALGGGGGGRADFANAGIREKDKLDEALSMVKDIIKAGGKQ